MISKCLQLGHTVKDPPLLGRAHYSTKSTSKRVGVSSRHAEIGASNLHQRSALP